MRRAAKVDANQSTLVNKLRQRRGVTVQATHTVGRGFPDIVVGYKKRNWLIELKNPDGDSYDRKLNPGQVRWHAKWEGQAARAETLDEVLEVIGYG